jgi:hypothetical protein
MKSKTRTRKAPKRLIPAQIESLSQKTFNSYTEAAIEKWASEIPPTFTGESYAALLEKYVDLAFKKVSARYHFKEKVLNVSVPAATVAEHLAKYDDIDLWAQEDFTRWVYPLITQSDLQNVGIRMDDLRKQANKLNLSTAETERIIRRNIARLYPDKRPVKVQRGEELIAIVEELNHIKEYTRSSMVINSFEQLHKIFSHFRIMKIMQTNHFDQDDREYLANASRWETHPGSYVRAILNKYRDEKSPQTYKDYRRAFKRWTREN